jgi:hypothetical protein
VIAMDKLSEGVIWVAFGYEYLILAAHSAKTLQDHSSNVKTAIYTNIPIKSIKYKDKDLFTYVEYINAPIGENRKWKLSMNILTPFQKTIYLDCDTEICAKIDPLFEILDYTPIAMKYNSYPTKHPVELYGKDNIYYGLSHWNGGVIAFNNSESKIEDFFKAWRENYLKLNKIADQYSLMKTVYESREIMPLPLSIIWNARNPLYHEEIAIKKSIKKMRIIHYWEPSDSPELYQKILSTYKHLKVDFASIVEKKKYLCDIMRTEKAFSASKPTIKEDVSYVFKPRNGRKDKLFYVKRMLKKTLKYFKISI